MSHSTTECRKKSLEAVNVNPLPGCEPTDSELWPYPDYDPLTYYTKYFHKMAMKKRNVLYPLPDPNFTIDPLWRKVWIHSQLTGSRLHGIFNGTSDDHPHRELLTPSITLNKLQIHCPICKRKQLYHLKHNKNPANPDYGDSKDPFRNMPSPSLDRITCHDPYIDEDTWNICLDCNVAKSDRILSLKLVVSLQEYAQECGQAGTVADTLLKDDVRELFLEEVPACRRYL